MPSFTLITDVVTMGSRVTQLDRVTFIEPFEQGTNAQVAAASALTIWRWGESAKILIVACVLLRMFFEENLVAARYPQ